MIFRGAKWCKASKTLFLETWDICAFYTENRLSSNVQHKKWEHFENFRFSKKNFFFNFFHRINSLEFFGHYWVIMRSHRVNRGHWRSQLVMLMTSFPNYYVINDFIDRTSLSCSNGLKFSLKWYFCANYQTNCHLKSKSMTFDVTFGPKITSGICKFSKWWQSVFWPRVTSNDLGWPCLAFY